MSKPEDIQDLIADAATQFIELAAARLTKGQEQYGDFAFMENDVIRMMQEELIDIANYAQMQFIKLSLLQAYLVTRLGTDQAVSLDEIGIGTFKGTKEGWK